MLSVTRYKRIYRFLAIRCLPLYLLYLLACASVRNGRNAYAIPRIRARP
jgi:hypothetical protein